MYHLQFFDVYLWLLWQATGGLSLLWQQILPSGQANKAFPVPFLFCVFLLGRLTNLPPGKANKAPSVPFLFCVLEDLLESYWTLTYRDIIDVKNLILKLVYFSQVFYLSTSLGVMFILWFYRGGNIWFWGICWMIGLFLWILFMIIGMRMPR